MAHVDIDNGYTRIANELLEVVMQQKFNGTQFKIIMAIWRYTYGFNRKDHELSLTFLSNATGVHKQTVKTELAKLIEQNVIIVTSESTHKTSRRLAFNKHYDKWNDLQEVKKLPVSESTTTPVSEMTYTPGSESTTYPVSEFTYQERNIKDNIKDNIKKPRKVNFSEIHLKLANEFYQEILINNPEHKKPNLNKWAEEMRKMMELDKRTEEQIRYLFKWVQQDNFEMANVLSPTKLRKRFDQLVIKVKSQKQRPSVQANNKPSWKEMTEKTDRDKEMFGNPIDYEYDENELEY